MWFFSSSAFDSCICEWLESPLRFSKDIESLPTHMVNVVLVILREFQHHIHEDSLDKVPSVIAVCLESTTNEERAELYIISLLFLSCSASLMSPIQRAYHSKWKSNFVRLAKNWRENVLELSRSCEPWVRARIRTASVAISRLIGPSVPLPVEETSEKMLAK